MATYCRPDVERHPIKLAGCITFPLLSILTMTKNYSIGILVLVSLVALISALFCYLVDPYGIYHQPNISKRETSQIDPFRHMRLAKAYQLEKVKPELLILGSSRAANLIPVSGVNGNQGYNASLPGMTLYEIRQYLKHAVQFHKPKKVLIALDFPSFFDLANKSQAGYVDSRMAKAQDDLKTVNSLRRHFRDYYPTLLTSSAIFDSIHALFKVHKSGIAYYSDGSWSASTRTEQSKRKSLFLLVANQYHRSALKSTVQDDFSELAEIIRYCYEEKIDASFYISPTHYLMIDAYQDTKLLSEYYAWHQDILNILEAQAQAAGKLPFPLFGFQNDFRAAGENILMPSTDDYFFNDVMHFNFSYGDIIRDAILYQSEGKSQQEHRHIQLKQSNIDQYIAEIETNLQRFRESNSELLSLFYKNKENAK
jgi:hypothetical protein